MKKYLFSLTALLCCTVLSLINSSCSNDDNDSTEPVVIEEARYYVKYEVELSGGRNNHSYTIEFLTQNGIKTISERKYGTSFSWDGTYGPFKKYDKVSLSVKTGGTLYVNARISVSRDKEPFAIRAETIDGNGASLSCIINF